MQTKWRVGIIFGGRTGEHEVSVASARSIIAAIDKNHYDIIPIAITRDGAWLPGVAPSTLLAPGEEIVDEFGTILPSEGETVSSLAAIQSQQVALGMVDVVFPVLHGTYGEDGAVQGLLEMAGIPYVGCGILGSALGMDKDKAKLLFQLAGLPVVPWITVTRHEVETALDEIVARTEDRFGYPVFVKPANMGSSVGVGKAHDAAELRATLLTAARYDRRILIEESINCREIECAVLGNDEPLASVVGEILPSNDFYDYEAKYLDGGASRLVIPADVPAEISTSIRSMAVTAFATLDLSGLSRVDFFLERETDRIFINEVNTLPGFTEISMYPKLWEASGLSYPELLDRLVQLALERHAERSRNETVL